MSDTLILGLGYKARHGKDFVARAIANAYSNVEVFSIAAGLKAYCRVAFGMREKEPHLLQLVGTDLLRARDPDIWVRVLMDTIAERGPSVAIVPDVRFPNEVAAIRHAGGYVAKITRYNSDGSLYVSEDRDPHHSSETALDGFDGWDATISCISGEADALTHQAIMMFNYIRGLRTGKVLPFEPRASSTPPQIASPGDAPR